VSLGSGRAVVTGRRASDDPQCRQRGQREREKENPKQVPCPALSPVGGSISQP